MMMMIESMEWKCDASFYYTATTMGKLSGEDSPSL